MSFRWPQARDMHISLPSFGVESQLLVYSSQKMGPFASVVFAVAFYNSIPLETSFIY